VSDPSVAYDAAHRVWLISSLALSDPPRGVAVLVSRSRDGAHWGAPVTVAAAGSGDDLDKNWTVCDNTRSSPFFGHCYTEFDDFGHVNAIKMSTSTDGGRTWGAPLDAAAGDHGIGGQPLVQPNGTVVVPIEDFVGRSILAFRSSDGGTSWSTAVTVSAISQHIVAGALRTSALPSAEVDGKGRVYVVWQDCRFRAGCASNDIVLSSSDDGINWSPVSRVPIDHVDSGADHFIPGLGVDPATSGSRARLALAYYYYPSAGCTSATCQLNVGLIQSFDGGANWRAPTQLAGPMSLSWLANTSQGVMVGDYISTSFVDGDPKPFFAMAKPPRGGLFDEAIYTTAGRQRPDEPGIRRAEQAFGRPVPQQREQRTDRR
jgi:BNR repeat protein